MLTDMNLTEQIYLTCFNLTEKIMEKEAIYL